ncbi:MAG: SGNH family hydrolase [Rhizobiaceae bacterium]
MSAIGLPYLDRSSTASRLIGYSSAAAQATSTKKRRSLFSILFGRKNAKRKAVKKKNRKNTRRNRLLKKKRSSKLTKKKSSKSKTKKTNRNTKKKKRRLRAVAKIVAPVVVIKKLENANTVLVFGDFFSGALAGGLEKGLTKVADVVVLDKSNGNSGFVRSDVIDWPVVLPSLLSETKPAYIVAMLGSNDRQLMRDNGAKLKKRTPEWDAAYKKRVEALGRVLKTSGIPFVWVGLPPVRFKSMNKDFLFFNELYAKAAQSRNGRFIDVWDGFSNADGNYSRSGPDVNGQIVLLRPKDGINLTRAGRRRLAYYVQGQIEKAISSGSSYTNSSLAFDIEANIPKTSTYNPARTGKTIVIRLDDPAIDGAQTLAGEKLSLGKSKTDDFTVPVFNRSAPKGQRHGRVDDYTWPPQAAAPSGSAALAIAN